MMAQADDARQPLRLQQEQRLVCAGLEDVAETDRRRGLAGRGCVSSFTMVKEVFGTTNIPHERA